MATGTIDTGTDQLLCEVRKRVALITLNRPESRNALGDTITPALRHQIKERSDDPDVSALLITGAGTAFCAGGDVKGMGGGQPALQLTQDQKVERLKELQRTLTGALVAVRKPTVAALPGPAAGAGLAIALACDIRIASASAFALPRRLPPAHARRSQVRGLRTRRRRRRHASVARRKRCL